MAELTKYQDNEQMWKITVAISRDLRKRLHKHIWETYPLKEKGRLQEVVGEAIREYLEKRGC